MTAGVTPPPSPPPPGAGRVVARAVALWLGSAVAFFVVTILAAATSGRTVAGGERAVLLAIGLDAGIVIATTAWLAWSSSAIRPVPRWVTVVAYFAVVALTALAMLFVTIVALNR